MPIFLPKARLRFLQGRLTNVQSGSPSFSSKKIMPWLRLEDNVAFQILKTAPFTRFISRGRLSFVTSVKDVQGFTSRGWHLSKNISTDFVSHFRSVRMAFLSNSTLEDRVASEFFPLFPTFLLHFQWGFLKKNHLFTSWFTVSAKSSSTAFRFSIQPESKKRGFFELQCHPFPWFLLFLKGFGSVLSSDSKRTKAILMVTSTRSLKWWPSSSYSVWILVTRSTWLQKNPCLTLGIPNCLYLQPLRVMSSSLQLSRQFPVWLFYNCGCRCPSFGRLRYQPRCFLGLCLITHAILYIHWDALSHIESC